MTKQTAFELRHGKTPVMALLSQSHFEPIEKVVLKVLSHLPLEKLKSQVEKTCSIELENFKIYSLGKEAWFDDVDYENSPMEYEIEFRPHYGMKIDQQHLIDLIAKFSSEFQMKQLEVKRSL